MTELTITPNVTTKTAKFKGAIAAGEHVAVTIKGGAQWIGTDAGANLSLRVIDRTTKRVVAIFPRPGEASDVWEASGSGNDLSCVLNLNTDRMIAAARRNGVAAVVVTLGDIDDPRTLYFLDNYQIMYWPEVIGDDPPYNMDHLPTPTDEWTELVIELAGALSDHVGDSGRHVTISQKDAWTAKYDKPNSGIPKSDLAQAVKDSLGKADTAVQAHQDLSEYVNGAVYDSNAKSIKFKHDTTVLFDIDATAFIKDGMVDSVEITGGNLVISFNTDAGIEDIEIPLTDIFNPSNYYDKTAADGRFVQKEAGKGLVAVDAALSTGGAAADAKAVGDALRGGFTEWVCDEISDGWTFVSCEWDTVSEIGTGWFANLANGSITISAFLGGNADSVNLEKEAQGNNPGVELSRHLITPTKTSQLTNNSGFLTSHQDISGKADKVSGATAGNLAALDAQGNLADSGVKPSDFAAKDDLPYRLVEPGKWEFSGVPSGVTVVSMSYSNYTWRLELSDGTTLDASSGGGEELIVGFYGGSGTITATRASLPGHLCDRAGNRVVVPGDTTLTLPAAVPGYIRDFLVRLEISGSTVPTITFSPDGNESVTYETDGDEFPVPDEAGDWLYSFTESCVAHKFAVSLKKVNTVAAPQAQGGA